MIDENMQIHYNIINISSGLISDMDVYRNNLFILTCDVAEEHEGDVVMEHTGDVAKGQASDVAMEHTGDVAKAQAGLVLVYKLSDGKPELVQQYNHSNVTQNTKFVNLENQMFTSCDTTNSLWVYSTERNDFIQLMINLWLVSPSNGHWMCAVRGAGLILCNRNSQEVCRINEKTGQVLWSVRNLLYPGPIACYKDNYVLVCGTLNQERAIYILDAYTGKYLAQVSIWCR